MELIINGHKESGEFSTVLDMLNARDLDPKRVVVELNGQILPAAHVATTPLSAGDTVEIVQFVGGG